MKSFNMGDKIGYAFGDFGCATFFAFVSSYLMVFYTDVLKGLVQQRLVHYL